ncbi:MAG: heavy metal translocating P-type ATPase [Myxococcota bacterium]
MTAALPASARYASTDASAGVRECAHCALPVPSARRGDGDGHAFCCDGCATVYAILHDHGLTAYYDLKAQDADGERVAAATTDHGYREYDDPTFAERFVVGDPEGARIDLYLEGVHCVACLWLIERLPELVPGVREARLDITRSVVRVRWSPAEVELSTVARWLDRLGYPPHPYRASHLQAARKREDRRWLMRMAVAGATAGNIMLMSFALYSGDFFGMAAPYAHFFRYGSMLLALPAVFWAGQPFLRGAINAIRTRTAQMDVPIALGILAGFFSGVVNTVRGEGDIYFDSVATLIFALLVGRRLQQRQQRIAADAAELKHALTPLHARRLHGDVATDIPVMAIAPGDRLEVRPGEPFPADGAVDEGETTVDAAVLTGESRPVAVRPGDPVHAGTVNLSGRVVMRAERTGLETRVGQIMEAVEEAARRRAPITSLADRISGWFVAVVVVLAVGVFAAWATVSVELAVDRAIALLIVSCPCALGMATPLAVAAALGRGARAGILIKGGDVLERLTRPCTFFFDKTGTLTEGGFRVLAWHERPGERGLVSRVAGIEQHAVHPLARALVAHAGDPEKIAPERITHAIGKGLKADLDDGRYRVGSVAWIAPGGPADLDGWASARLDDVLATGATPVLVARGEQVVAVVGLGDEVRSDARASLDALRAWGHEVQILSGDHPAAVARTAERLGVAEARGGARPETKLDVVEASVRPAVMVGDGVNDAAALSAAAVGVAVHGGAEASLAAADVFITRAGVGPVVELVAGARRTMGVIRRNLVFSLLYNVVGITHAATGGIGPRGAAVLMPFSSLTVVASSYQARTFPSPRRS